MLPNPQESPVGSDGSPDSSGLHQPRLTSSLPISPPPVQALDVDGIASFLFRDRQAYALFEAALDAMVVANDQGYYVAANRAACELFGTTQEDLLGRCIADFTPPNFDLEQDWQTFQQQGQERGEFSLMRADGLIREVEYAATANFIPHYHLSILRDITERKQLERQLQHLNRELEQQVAQRTTDLQKAYRALQVTNQQLQANQQAHLRESEARFRAAFEASPDAVLITRLSDGLILDVNPQFVQMSGYSRLEAIGQTTIGLQLWANPSDRATIAARLQTESTVQNYECSFRRKSEELIVGLFSCQMLDLGGQVCVLSVIRDISDRKRAELALQEKEARLQRLAANIAGMIYQYVLYANGSEAFTYVSPKCREIYELEAEELMQDFGQVWTMIHPEDVERVRQANLQSAQRLERFDIEFRLLPASGHVRWLRAVSQPEQQPNGDIVWDGLLLDITDRKVAEASLYQQEQEFRMLAQNAQLLNQIVAATRSSLDLDQVLQQTTDALLRALQCSRTMATLCNATDPYFTCNSIATLANLPDLQGRLFPIAGNFYTQLVLSQDAPVVVHDVTTEPTLVAVLPLVKQLEIRSMLSVSIRQPQATLGMLCIHQCDRLRVWTEGEQHLLKQVADQLAIAIQQAELYRQVQQLNINLEQQVNDRTADLQQALEFELLLQRITDQVRDSLEEDQILETVVAELGQGLNLECCDTGIYNADLTTSTIAHEFTRSLPSVKGSVFPIAEASHYDIYPLIFQGITLQFCDLVPCALRLPQGRFTILVCPIMDDQRVLGDMWLYKYEAFSPSEVRLVRQVANQCAIALRQSRLYQAAQAQVRELERLNQLKDDFLSTVSHELRTPMSNIKMATQMLEISLDRLGILRDESTPISRYFNVLREEGQREINLINDLLDLTRLDAGIEPLSLTKIPLQAYLPHLVEPFTERACQYQQQLILQIPENLPPLTTHLPYLERIVSELLHNACKYTPAGNHISLTAEAISMMMKICVSNSGVEILPDECDRIFDKFYRIPNNDPWKHGGTGLGLALVKKLTERLEGKIYVESSNGQTTFILELANC